jgi:hypothetical protein
MQQSLLLNQNWEEVRKEHPKPNLNTQAWILNYDGMIKLILQRQLHFLHAGNETDFDITKDTSPTEIFKRFFDEIFKIMQN